MFNKKKKDQKTDAAEMKWRFINKRDSKLSIIVVKNVLLPKQMHVVDSDIKFTINPFKKTAQLFVGDRKNDMKISKVEVEGDSNVNIDLDLTYKISGEAYFEEYWVKNNLKESQSVDNSSLVAKLDAIKVKITDAENGQLTRRDFIKIKEVLNIMLYRDVTDNDFLDRVRNAKTAVSNKINNMDDEFNLNVIDDIVNDAKIIFDQPINSNNQEKHREAVKKFNEYDADKKAAELKEWQYNHGAVKYYNMASHNYEFLNKIVEDEVNTYIKTMCAQMDYEEVKSIKHLSDSVVAEINEHLKEYGLEITAIRVKVVDQFNPEYDAAHDKVEIAKLEAEADLVKGRTEAEIKRLQGEAEADNKRKLMESTLEPLENSNVDNNTKTAVAGGNVNVNNINIPGLDAAVGAMGNAVSGLFNNNTQTNDFREVNTAGTETTEETVNQTNETTVNQEENTQSVNLNSGNGETAQNTNSESEFNVNFENTETTVNQANSAENTETPKSNVDEIYIRLEMLQNAQKKAIAELDNYEKGSDKYIDTCNKVVEYGAEIKELEKQYKLK